MKTQDTEPKSDPEIIKDLERRIARLEMIVGPVHEWIGRDNIRASIVRLHDRIDRLRGELGWDE